jgi:hypothetical protein
LMLGLSTVGTVRSSNKPPKRTFPAATNGSVNKTEIN